MSAVRQELIDQLEKLDERQQQQVLAYARTLTSPGQVTWEQWLARATQAQAELRVKYGDHHFFESQSILDAVREERLNDLTDDRMGRP
ncbi:MAG TPA: hypothetical protein VH393_15665 [Ktedonobacterales bacterium]